MELHYKGWKKINFLGSGSYGKVYLAMQPTGDTAIAVKSVENNRSFSLRREGQLLHSLQGCPYIVRCFGDDTSLEDGDYVYNLLMEHAPGGSLSDLIKSRGGKMSELEIACYTYQLLKGIDYVHKQGLAHCDIKPSNVLVFPDEKGMNKLKLCDFGLAKKAKESDGCFGNCHVGTKAYAPPESLTCKEYNTPKDIWALGVMVVEMLTGKFIWATKDNIILLEKNKKLYEPKIPNNIPISFMAIDFVKRCLSRDPRDRWTAHMLLRHQFITYHTRGFDVSDREKERCLDSYSPKRGFDVSDREKERCLDNPFGRTRWTSNNDLFNYQ